MFWYWPARGGARRGVRPCLGGVELPVAVGVAALQSRHDAGVVHHRDLRDRDVARVADHVRPGDGRARGELGPRRGVGVLSVRVLLHVDPGHDAEVVRGIAVAQLGAGRVGPDHRARVLVLAERRGAARGAIHLGVHGQRRRRARDRHAAIVGDGDPGERRVARVVDGVGPCHRVTDADGGAGRSVGVVAVGALLEVDSRMRRRSSSTGRSRSRARPPRSIPSTVATLVYWPGLRGSGRRCRSSRRRRRAWTPGRSPRRRERRSPRCS